jgi:hypothetical protein
MQPAGDMFGSLTGSSLLVMQPSFVPLLHETRAHVLGKNKIPTLA